MSISRRYRMQVVIAMVWFTAVVVRSESVSLSITDQGTLSWVTSTLISTNEVQWASSLVSNDWRVYRQFVVEAGTNTTALPSHEQVNHIFFRLRTPTNLVSVFSSNSTDSNGLALFTDVISSGSAEISVTTTSSVPVPDADVLFVDGAGWELFFAEEEGFLPSLGLFRHNSAHGITMYVDMPADAVATYSNETDEAQACFDFVSHARSHGLFLGRVTPEELKAIDDTALWIYNFVPVVGPVMSAVSKVAQKFESFLSMIPGEISEPDFYDLYEIVPDNPITTTLRIPIPVTIAPPPTLVNGDFETGDLTGWNPIGHVSNTPASRYCALNGGDLTPNGATISQTIAVIPGVSYTLQFDFGKNGSASGTSAARLDVYTGAGVLLHSLSMSETRAVSWEEFSIELVSSDSSMLIKFTDTTSGSARAYDAVIDNVILY